MIEGAVGFLVRRLDEHLRRQFGAPDRLALAGPIIDADGAPVEATRNQLVVFVTNISHAEILANAAARQLAREQPPSTSLPTPANLELSLMLASNFDPQNYDQSLKVLSAARQFFAATPVFDQASAPGLDQRIMKLVVEPQNLEIEALSQLWALHGGRYVPSALFRVRMMAADAGATSVEPPIVRRLLPGESNE